MLTFWELSRELISFSTLLRMYGNWHNLDARVLLTMKQELGGVLLHNPQSTHSKYITQIITHQYTTVTKSGVQLLSDQKPKKARLVERKFALFGGQEPGLWEQRTLIQRLNSPTDNHGQELL